MLGLFLFAYLLYQIQTTQSHTRKICIYQTYDYVVFYGGTYSHGPENWYGEYPTGGIELTNSLTSETTIYNFTRVIAGDGSDIPESTCETCESSVSWWQIVNISRNNFDTTTYQVTTTTSDYISTPSCGYSLTVTIYDTKPTFEPTAPSSACQFILFFAIFTFFCVCFLVSLLFFVCLHYVLLFFSFYDWQAYIQQYPHLIYQLWTQHHYQVHFQP